MYEAIVTIHILSGMAWVGAGFVFWLGARNIARERGEREATEVLDRLDKATMIIGLGPLLVLATGVAQVLMSQQHDWSDLWVMLAVVLALTALGLGMWNDSTGKKKLEEGVPPASALNRMLRLLEIELVVMAAIVALMVFKPV